MYAEILKMGADSCLKMMIIEETVQPLRPVHLTVDTLSLFNAVREDHQGVPRSKLEPRRRGRLPFGDAEEHSPPRGFSMFAE